MKRMIDMRWLLSSAVLALGALLASASTLVTPASAVIAQTAKGHVVSYQPTVAKAAAMRALRRLSGGSAARTPTGGTRRSAGPYQACSSPEEACLSYYGHPVMRTTTLTPIFWNPGKLSLKYPAGFISEVTQFFIDLSADSGKETNFFSLLTQYYSGEGHVRYAVGVHAPIEDSTEPTLAERCIAPVEPAAPCVNDAGIQHEVERVIVKGGLPRGLGNEYVVFLPDGMHTCFKAGGITEEAERECSGTAFCAYHGAIEVEKPNTVEYANEPENGQYGTGCTGKPGLPAGYVTLSSTSHEVSESVTDPEPHESVTEEAVVSWYDFNEVGGVAESQFGEIGDMCAYEYEQGEPAGQLWRGLMAEPIGVSNQTINGHSYLLQSEWDNMHSTCSVSEQAASPIAAFNVSSTEAPTATSISFNGSGSHGPEDSHRLTSVVSYEWNWGDGTRTVSASPLAEHVYSSARGLPSLAYPVTLTITDSNGNTASSTKQVTVVDRPPTSAISAPVSVIAGTAAAFGGSASSDPDGTIAAYSWNFGDGTPAQEGSAPSHTYTKAGTYTVSLTVTDDSGKTAASTSTVTVAEPPNGLTFGKVTRNRDGSLNVTVTVPYAGMLSGHDGQKGILARFAQVLAEATGSKAHRKGKVHKPAKKKATALVASFSLNVAAPGQMSVHLAPTPFAKAELKRHHSLPFSVLFTFSPLDGTPAPISQSYAFTSPAAKKAKRHKRHR